MTITSVPLERFWRKVEKTEDCWLWKGSTFKGYGKFTLSLGGAKQKWVRAHRWIYEQFHGEIAAELVVDHLCRVRHCVNPNHMEIVTNAENLRRQTPRRSGK